MKLLRDPETGRFRKPTDEERWPNQRERDRMLRIRGIFEGLHPHMAEMVRQAGEDLKFLGTIYKPHA